MIISFTTVACPYKTANQSAVNTLLKKKRLFVFDMRKCHIKIFQWYSVWYLQIRYFNPKTKNFYFHGLTAAGLPSSTSNKNDVLVGEPEYFYYPEGNEGEGHVQGYVNAFLHHHAVIYLIFNQNFKKGHNMSLYDSLAWGIMLISFTVKIFVTTLRWVSVFDSRVRVNFKLWLADCSSEK